MGKPHQGGPVIVGSTVGALGRGIGPRRYAQDCAWVPDGHCTRASLSAAVEPVLGGGVERLLCEVAEPTFDQIREHLPSISEQRMQLLAEGSSAAGLHALADREGAALIVVGSSHRSRIGRILVGGTGERLLSGASAPVAIAQSPLVVLPRGADG
jgi:nucleotide-binding universal stress UspA family protein